MRQSADTILALAAGIVPAIEDSDLFKRFPDDEKTIFQEAKEEDPELFDFFQKAGYVVGFLGTIRAGTITANVAAPFLKKMAGNVAPKF